ncbi:ATPase, T2SS/T4P/T4SS family [Paraburkholderia silvatlantica]|uniref:ATPase, T2SS/T4P/T4SS family n=1 Tax=Paraburkholderia silvatlantica TaxID=321895 RepID=UPI003750B655
MEDDQQLQVSITGRDGRAQTHTLTKSATLGKDPACDIVLKGLLIGRVQAIIEPRNGHWYIEDKGGLASTLVNGAPITSFGPLTGADSIEIASFRIAVARVEQSAPQALHLVEAGAAREGGSAAKAASEPVNTAAMAAVQTRTVAREPIEAQSATSVESAQLLRTGTDGLAMAGAMPNGVVAMPRERPAAPPVMRAPQPASPVAGAMRAVPEDAQEIQWLNTPEGIELRKTGHARLIAAIDLRRLNVARMSEEELSTTVGGLLRTVLSSDPTFERPGIPTEALFKSIFDEVIGLGPLESLLADESITEIMVNRYNEIFIERGGQLTRSSTIFTDDQAVLGAIERIVAPLGRRIDESSPMVDARLKDGSRVNAVIPPLALKGPNITIRKFSKRKLQGEDLVCFGSLSPHMLEFLRVAVERRANIVISGGTGSGKTTLLNVLSNFIPDNERIVTVEDAAELQLSQSNLVSLEARPANMEGKGAVHIRDLVKNTLRMRPDRIVVGECRGGEALDMLQAMNTGHDGSLTTAHANSPRDCLSRLEVMTLMAGLDLPVHAIREQVVSAVDLIVQQTRFSCGTRRVTHVTEVSGIESGTVQMQDVFVFRQSGYSSEGKVQGTFHSTGYIPDFYQDLIRRGIQVDTSIFQE